MATVELDFRAVANKAIKDIDSLNKRVDTLTKNTKTSSLAFAGLASIGIAGVISGIGSAISNTVEQSRKMEDLTAQFQTLTGSADAAKMMMEDLADFTSRTPFQLEGVAKSARTLLAFGTSVDDVKPLLGDLGDVAAATGASLEEISLVFGQVRAEGKLTGERWRQLAERGIVLDDLFAKKLGVSTKQVRKEISKGSVSFDMFREAFEKLNDKGGKAEGGMARLAGTLSGKLSTLNDNIDLFAGRVGSKFAPALKIAVDALNELLTPLEKKSAVEVAREELQKLQQELDQGFSQQQTGGFLGFQVTDADRQGVEEKVELKKQEIARLEAVEKEAAAKEQKRKAAENKKKLEDQKKEDARALKARGTFYSNWKSFVTDFKTFEKSTGKERIANMRSTLGTISTLTSSNNKTLFRVGQASAIATATVDGITAVQKALASAPPPFNFILAGLVGTATALNVQKIASAKPPAYEQGGVVGGSSYTGDNVLAAVNSNEVILNGKQQAETLFQIANGGLQGNNAVDAINALGDRIANLEVVVMTSDIEIARSVNRAVDNGFQLKGAA